MIDLGPMTQQFLLGGAVISAIMTLVWLARLRGKGRRAWVMAGSFLVLGGLCLLAWSGSSPGWIIAGGVLLAALLALDILMRAAEAAK
jgi:hypothetical protein